MSVTIKIDGEALDTRDAMALTIEDKNMIYNDTGSMSVTSTVPATGRNGRLLGWPWRLHAAGLDEKRDCEICAGGWIRAGRLNITSAQRGGDVELNVGFDESTAYDTWKGKRLPELSSARIWDLLDARMAHYIMNEAISNGMDGDSPAAADVSASESRALPFAVFPVAVRKEEDDDSNTTYWEILNQWREGNTIGRDCSETSMRLVDGEMMEVTVPAAYGITPFLKVWRVLEIVWADLGLKVTRNPFFTDWELRRLVVLNNTADACVTGRVNEAELLPDVTVETLMQALWARFGLVYRIDYTAGTVEMRLLSDILTSASARDLSSLITSRPEAGAPGGRYLKLKCATGLDGAAPLTERFEDYMAGYEFNSVFVSRIPTARTNYAYFYDTATSTWAKRGDAASATGRARESSSWFSWDPATEGLEAEELSSSDEAVAMVVVDTDLTGADLERQSIMPYVAVGSRHRHTELLGLDSEVTEEEMPLCFCFAFHNTCEVPEWTVGRISPEIDSSTLYTWNTTNAKRQTHRTALYWQFAHGLFARFWTRYDELLRHGDREVKVTARMKTSDLQHLEMLRPVTLDGVRCLIDTASYTLKGTGHADVELTLRTIDVGGSYNIIGEQGVAMWDVAARRLRWVYLSDDFSNIGVRELAKALEAYVRSLEDQRDIDEFSIEAVGVNYEGATWEADSSIPALSSSPEGSVMTRTYKARVSYEITDSTTGDVAEWEWLASYTVKFVSRWTLAGASGGAGSANYSPDGSQTDTVRDTPDWEDPWQDDHAYDDERDPGRDDVWDDYYDDYE